MMLFSPQLLCPQEAKIKPLLILVPEILNNHRATSNLFIRLQSIQQKSISEAVGILCVVDDHIECVIILNIISI